MSHVYSSDFYDYINAGSTASARCVVPLMRSVMTIDSVLDVGAGVGAWAAQWLAGGTPEVTAVDGAYAEDSPLLVPARHFVAHDLTQPMDLDRKFDLVQSLEVAEHIPEDKADVLVESLVRHGDVVMFSAAVPGQGGEFHINEQPLEYWRQKFASHGYAPFDWLRPQMADQDDIEPWYRYNTIIYANETGQAKLAAQVLAACIPDDRAVPHAGSAAWRMRRAMVSAMPTWMVTRIAATLARQKARAHAKAAA